MSERDITPPAHEAVDITLRPLLIGAVGLGVVVVLLVLLANALFPQRSLDKMMRVPFPVAPQPQLQANPTADMVRFRAAQMQRLNSFGWIDHTHGVAHMPVAQAMRLVATQGVPNWPASPSSPASKGTRP